MILFVRVKIVGNKEKGRNSIQVFQENKALQIFLAYQGVRNVHFPENLAWFVFVKHPF